MEMNYCQDHGKQRRMMEDEEMNLCYLQYVFSLPTRQTFTIPEINFKYNGYPYSIENQASKEELEMIEEARHFVAPPYSFFKCLEPINLPSVEIEPTNNWYSTIWFKIILSISSCFIFWVVFRTLVSTYYK